MYTIAGGKCEGCGNTVISCKQVGRDLIFTVECRGCGGQTNFSLETIKEALAENEEWDSSLVTHSTLQH